MTCSIQTCFVIQILTKYLNDFEVVLLLGTLCLCIRQQSNGYHINDPVTQQAIEKIDRIDIFPYIFKQIKEVLNLKRLVLPICQPTHLWFSDNYNHVIAPNVFSIVEEQHQTPTDGPIPTSVTHITFGEDFDNGFLHEWRAEPVNPAFKYQMIDDYCVWTKCRVCQRYMHVDCDLHANIFGECTCVEDDPWDEISGCKCSMNIDDDDEEWTYGNTILSPYGYPKIRFLPGVIPNSVTHLSFGYGFHRELATGSIPNSIVHLTLRNVSGTSGVDVHPNILPQSITYLDITDFYQDCIREVIPKSVVYLKYGIPELLVGSIPNSVKFLMLDEQIDGMIQNIPNSVTHFSAYRNIDLPESVTHLRELVSHNLVNRSELRHISHLSEFCGNRNAVLKFGSHWNGLTHIEFQDIFNQCLDVNLLPRTLTNLVFGKSFTNGNIVMQQQIIPDSVQCLTFRGSNKMLDENSIPHSVKHLVFRHNEKPCKIQIIPSSVTHVVFHTNYRLDHISKSIKNVFYSDFNEQSCEICDWVHIWCWFCAEDQCW